MPAMVDGNSIIHFCANSVSSEKVLHCLYEIGCRIKRPFLIHRTVGTVPSEGFVILIGDYPAGWEKNRPGINFPEPDYKTIKSDWIDGLDRLEQHSNPFELAFKLLCFSHEYSAPLDYMGRVPPEGNLLTPKNRVLRPWLEMIASEIWRRSVQAGCPEIRPHEPWPRDRIHFCFTHDVDGPELFSLFATMRSGYLGLIRNDKYERESFLMSLLMRREGASDPYFAFDLWREYESILEGNSTFFVYPGRLESGNWHRKDPKYNPQKLNIRNALKRAADAGWEIGAHFGIESHGYHAYQCARLRLNELVSTELEGGRSHYWVMDWRDPYRTWRDMWRAGFRYDMSLSPMTLGFRGGFMFPITPSYRWTGRGGPKCDVSERFSAVPSAIMDAYAIPRIAQCSRDEVDRKLDLLLDAAQDQGAPLILDWHVRTFINRGAWTGYLEPLVYLITEAQRRGPISVVSGAQMVRRWQAHIDMIYRGTL